MIARFIRSLLTFIAAFALLLTMAPLAANAAPGDDGTPIPKRIDDMVPALDSPSGRGEPLPGGEAVAFPAGGAGMHSALIRLSVFSPDVDTQISAAGAHALHVAKGRSSSTTVLVPLTSGKFSVLATRTAQARVEVLATFGGTAASAGVTLALPTAVARPADGSLLSAGPGDSATFGLVGAGGVPSDGVRAVHASLTVRATTATTVKVGAQTLPVKPGTTVLSTVLTPSAAGDVEVTAGVPVTVGLHVRGWVTGATAGPNNGPGAYWPEPHKLPISYTANPTPKPVEVHGRADASHVMALIWAAAAKLTALEAGDLRPGRTRGAVVDPATGAQPQLVILPIEDAEMVLHHGSATARVMVLGSFIGDAGAPALQGPITVDSPVQGPVDLGDHLTVTFSGHLDLRTSTPQRIEVTLQGHLLGLATMRPSASGVTWEFTTGIREPGERAYVFTLIGRDDTRTATTWRGIFTIPGAEAVIIQDDVIILGRSDDDPEQLELTDDAVAFATDPGFVPGEVIVSDVTEAAPDGFLRRVRAVDETPDGFVVHTGPATLEDVFLQVKREAWQPMLPGARPVELPATEPGGVALTGHAVVPADEAFVELPHEAEMEAVTDDTEIDEPPTDWSGRVGASVNALRGAAVGPMAMPVPRPPRPEDDQGGDPPPSKAQTTGESEYTDVWDFKLQDKGTKGAVSYDMKLEGMSAIGMEVVFVLEVDVAWAGPLPYPVVKQFETSLLTRVQVRLEGDLDINGAWKKEWKSSIPLLRFPTMTVFVGPVPVVIAFNVDLTIKANVSMSAAFHLGFTQVSEAWFKIGFAYRDGKWAAINDGATKFGDPVMDSDAIFQGQVRAAAGPEIMAKLMLYDTFGPALGFGLKAGVDLDAKMEANGLMARVKIYFTGSVLVQVSLKIPVINVDVTDLTILEGDILRWNLVDWNYDYYDLLTVPRPDPDPDPTDPPTTDPPDPTDPPTTDPPDPVVIDALEFAKAIELREYIYGGDDAWYEDRVPIAAEWVDGPPSPGSAAIVKGDFSLPPTVLNQYEDTRPEAQFLKGRYPVLGTGGTSFWDPGAGSKGKPGPAHRGEGVTDSTTLKIDLPPMKRASCVSIAVLVGDSSEEGIFAAEWGGTSWRHEGDMQFSSEHAVNDEVITPWFPYPGEPVYRMNRAGQDTRGVAPFRFQAVTRWQISGDIGPGNSLYLSTAAFDPKGRGAAMAIESITFMDSFLCPRQPKGTRQLWSVRGLADW
ncbi:hypothetical protein [Tessaracoccus massiliensis]|uniref:hypothetical protein n=1 Tax=Tessaracoccus massiliensis TaxID=1522311 RepID=UPI0005902A82|nr:hypothetical protein [Tessaracoccus massiliensis]